MICNTSSLIAMQNNNENDIQYHSNSQYKQTSAEIKDKIRELRNNNTSTEYYKQMLSLLYESLLQYHNNINYGNKHYTRQFSQNLHYNNDNCCIVIRYLMLLILESNTVNSLLSENPEIICDVEMCDQLNNIVKIIRNKMTNILEQNSVNSKTTDSVFNLFDQMSNDIITNDILKFKQFYNKYYTIVDNIPQYNGLLNLCEEFDKKYDYYNWFEQKYLHNNNGIMTHYNLLLTSKTENQKNNKTSNKLLTNKRKRTKKDKLK